MGGLERRDWAAAETEARGLLDASPIDVHRIALVEALIAQGRWVDALQVDATVEAPTPRSLLLRSIALVDSGQVAEATSALEDCWLRLKDAPEDLLVGAELAKVLGQDLEAIGFAHRAAVLAPTSPVALTLLGQLLIGHDDTLARRRIERSLALDPEQAAAWTGLSQLQVRAGDARGARASASRALAIAPAWTEAQKAYALASRLSLSAGERGLMLAPIVASLGLAVAALSAGLTSPRLWALLGASILCLLATLCLEVALRRRRRRALAVTVQEAGPRSAAHIPAISSRTDSARVSCAGVISGRGVRPA